MGFTCLSLLSLFFLFSFQEKRKEKEAKRKEKPIKSGNTVDTGGRRLNKL